MDKINYVPIGSLLPVDDKFDAKWNKFLDPTNNKDFYSLVTKVWLSEKLELQVHRSFPEAIQAIENRSGVRGKDYVILSLMQDGGWHIHARIDRHFISEEDVVNE